MELARSFDPLPQSVGQARSMVSGAVADVCPSSGEAELLVSELATNAVIHARTPYEVWISVNPGGIRVAVSDDDPTPPVVVPLPGDGGDGLGGRGLAMVAALAARWGCDRTAGGKTVWFEL